MAKPFLFVQFRFWNSSLVWGCFIHLPQLVKLQSLLWHPVCGSAVSCMCMGMMDAPSSCHTSAAAFNSDMLVLVLLFVKGFRRCLRSHILRYELLSIFFLLVRVGFVCLFGRLGLVFLLGSGKSLPFYRYWIVLIRLLWKI